jgi:hypothetical protein
VVKRKGGRSFVSGDGFSRPVTDLKKCGALAPEEQASPKQKAQPDGCAFKTSLLDSEYQTAINQLHFSATLFSLESATCKITLLTNRFPQASAPHSNEPLNLFPFVV